MTTLWTCDSRRGGGEVLVKHFSDDRHSRQTDPSNKNNLVHLPQFLFRCQVLIFYPLNAELYSICHLLALLGAHHIFHVSELRVNLFFCNCNLYSTDEWNLCVSLYAVSLFVSVTLLFTLVAGLLTLVAGLLL